MAQHIHNDWRFAIAGNGGNTNFLNLLSNIGSSMHMSIQPETRGRFLKLLISNLNVYFRSKGDLQLSLACKLYFYTDSLQSFFCQHVFCADSLCCVI